MKVTDIKVNIIPWDVPPLQYRGDFPVLAGKVNVLLVKVLTDEGIEGHAFARGNLADTIETFLKPAVVGEDPLARERIWHKIWTLDRVAFMPMTAHGCIDVALWDIAGKVSGLPIYKLLGAYRDKVKAYASSRTLPTVEAYAEEVLQYKEKGYTAYKLHVWGEPDRDLAACRAAREAAGSDMELMLDAVGAYDRRQALKVGRALEELDFYWFEEPLPDHDIEGYVQLRRSLDIPVAGAESADGSFYGAAEYIVRDALDIVRSDVVLKGGITGLKKTADICDAFSIKCEIHTTALPLMNAANLHVTCAVKNCDFFEVLVPEEIFNYGVKQDIAVDSKGYVHAPTGPGLGLDIDWSQVQ